MSSPDDDAMKTSFEVSKSLWDAVKMKAIKEHSTVKEILQRAIKRELGLP